MSDDERNERVTHSPWVLDEGSEGTGWLLVITSWVSVAEGIAEEPGRGSNASGGARQRPGHRWSVWNLPVGSG